MLSLRAFYVLLSIPIKLLLVIIKYPFFGGINEKFKNSLKNSLKLQLCRTALSMPVKDSYIISILSNWFLINKLIKFLYPNLTKNLNNYGKNYDKQSIWLVESPQRSKNDPILIFLHGGGYYIETQPSQLESLISIYHLLEPSKKSKLSILHFDYKLACRGAIVTTQLYQLVETYKKLTEIDGNSNIILMGDSAGGHLAITFLQYLKQKRDQNEIKNIVWPKSLILISPWCKIHPEPHQNTKGWSYYENSKRDMIQLKYFQEIDRQESIIGNLNHVDMLVSPGNLPYKYSDWDDIPTLSQPGNSIFVILGEHEVFRDDILEWCQYAVKSPLIKQKLDSRGKIDIKLHEYKSNPTNGGPLVEIFIEPWGVHDSSLFFENDIIKQVNKHKGNLKLSQLKNREQYFGILKIVNFLNEILKNDFNEDGSIVLVNGFEKNLKE
ncbi:uncharacterized protein KGF55_002208 [Candida pseudojiufengensis]|uniref:uncharacterized protein n=1 Tax=Candida pseudojiufengensis TaxID=497109 RepID=UPI002224562A|nr:uncharacterized protein KGF55_002208 [Candida pseudojiufengensis]KAI5964266.1 hypothetical protein KGF55_002208 [Candida pseudojiufengensis]